METEQWHLKFDEFGDACDYVVCFQLWNVISAAYKHVKCFWFNMSMKFQVSMMEFSWKSFSRWKINQHKSQIMSLLCNLPSSYVGFTSLWAVIIWDEIKSGKLLQWESWWCQMCMFVKTPSAQNILRFISFRQRLLRCKRIFSLKS